MSDKFTFDVFLSHSSKDKAVVREIAGRLKRDGLRVWFDEWVLEPGDDEEEKVEQGLEHSRVLVFCMSANAFGADWAKLEARTLRFRDPLNRRRRFIPLKLDDAPVKDPLAQFLFIDWLNEDRRQAYAKLLDGCRGLPPTTSASSRKPIKIVQVKKGALTHAFSPDGNLVLASAKGATVDLWDLETKQCLRVLNGHKRSIERLVWSKDRRRALSASIDKTVRLWDVETGRCLRVLEGHSDSVFALAWSSDNSQALSGSSDKSVRLWDVEEERCVGILEGHTARVLSVVWSSDQRRALSGSADKTIRLWDLERRVCLAVFEGHTGPVSCLSWSTDERQILSASVDKTIRLWETETGKCLRVLEGHTGPIRSLAWTTDRQRALSGGVDRTVRLWDPQKGQCFCIFQGHGGSVRSVGFSEDERFAFSGEYRGRICVWDLSESVENSRALQSEKTDQVQYTNAKVLLVGETSAGKTGLSMRLALDTWKPSDSTVGAWATHWKLPVSSAEDTERELWLWDFGGQADQRLIHQLYMEDTALAVLVFDGQREDVFETLGQWDRDLTRASRKQFTKILVAGRIDAGGLRVSRTQIAAFAEERGFSLYLETSAKANIGCSDLKNAILSGIRWPDIPWRASPRLFKRLKEEILRLKDDGRVLMRFNELRDALHLRMTRHDGRFKDTELRAVISLLAGPGVVWELAFGSWVLLQPERINAYAQAVIQTMREDKHERGCLPEERVLKGELNYQSSIGRLEVGEERFVLLAMHQTLVERGLCLREHTDQGPLLIFPSYYRRERPELVGHPAVLVSYRFNGFLDEIYATLVVRLHHTKPFHQDQLWRYAADFKTLTGKQVGIKLTRRSEGAGELDVYFDPAIPIGEKIIFSKYVHEHLLQTAKEVVRLRHYVCPYCGTPAGNREVAMRKLEEGKTDIPCVNCDDPSKRIVLWDEMEGLFASRDMQLRVRELQQQSAIVLDNESRERVLVGEVISTVALAGQICREFNVSDHGIDMEIEFKSDSGKATGQKLYLQLKSGDSYLRQRKSDGAEIFTIKDERHLHYWMGQPVPVMLVIRTSQGEVRWMEVRDWLKRATEQGQTPVKQIVFDGRRFDVMSVRQWRDKILNPRYLRTEARD